MNDTESSRPSSWNVESDEATTSRRSPLLYVGAAVLLIAVVIGGFLVFNRAKDAANQEWPDSISRRPAGLGATNDKAPTVSPTAAPGAYVWNDFDGFHLWIVPGEGAAAVKGTITSNKDFGDTALAAPGNGSQKTNGSTITFELPQSEHIIGVDFNPGFYASKVTITLTAADGSPIFDGKIHVGSKATAMSSPVELKKVNADDAATS